MHDYTGITHAVLNQLRAVRDGTEAALTITAHLLGLLFIFVGESLTLRLVRDAWRDASLTFFHLLPLPFARASVNQSDQPKSTFSIVVLDDV
jgi:hypothetical protein